MYVYSNSSDHKMKSDKICNSEIYFLVLVHFFFSLSVEAM